MDWRFSSSSPAGELFTCVGTRTSTPTFMFKPSLYSARELSRAWEPPEARTLSDTEALMYTFTDRHVLMCVSSYLMRVILKERTWSTISPLGAGVMGTI
jgi:hypothetical protein